MVKSMTYPSSGNSVSGVDDGVGARVSVGEVVAVAGTGVEVGALVGLGVIGCGVGTVPQATSRMNIQASSVRPTRTFKALHLILYFKVTENPTFFA